MNKYTFFLISFLAASSFCFANEIKSIKIELIPSDSYSKTKIIYDSEKDDGSYPFLIFSSCLNGWGRKGGMKRISPLLVPKNIQPEGTYIIYVESDKSDSIKNYRLLNFKAIQEIQTGKYYETDFLQYLYEYIVKKYLELNK